ncbi:MAG: MFS transporter [Deltaproteobacteria bacterium]|nr:MAG: MFS transporter [Deltaproteobacteria bacterium]
MRRKEIISWALYDFANTIFSANVISIYFPLWLTQELGGEQIHYSLAISASMLAVAFTMPLLGILSDRWGRRKPLLFLFTLACAFATGGLGTLADLSLALLCFALANYAYQGGLVFYNALLPGVSSEGELGRVSGLGVGLGYLGAILGVVMVTPFVSGRLWGWDVPFLTERGNAASFLPTALLFLLFSLPIFLWVKEPAEEGIWREKRVWKALLQIKAHPQILRFLVARFFYLDGINTAIVFMSVYLVNVVGFSGKGEVQDFFIVSTTFAILGGIGWGVLTDRWGHRRTLSLVLLLFTSAIIAATLATTKFLFWFIGPLIGIALAGVWTSDRPLLITLSPPGMYGEFFGLYSLSGKLAAIIGPLQWGILVKLCEPLGLWKYRIAIFSLTLFFVLGLLILRKLPR